MCDGRRKPDAIAWCHTVRASPCRYPHAALPHIEKAPDSGGLGMPLLTSAKP
ncbi:hypothetical protein SAMN05446635_4838 [Burkholderia sp. OK233]|nr:hypothetical protein SAMN05446635_4838 [Burkholderia sp. OK233]